MTHVRPDMGHGPADVVRNRADVQLLVHDPRAERILRRRGLDLVVALDVWLAPVE